MKRTLALFLSLMMVFSLFSGLNITAGAAETDVTETAAEAEVTESTTESELPELDLHLPEPESETEGSAAKADLAEIGAEPDLADTGATYELWLGSTQVTDANKSDILGDGGKAQFDPSTHTLTLNNPTINGEHNYSKIFCNGFDLTVKGSYTMTSAQSDNALTVFDHDLTLDGNFTLLAWCYAVETSYDINVNGGRVTAKLEEGDSEACQAFCSDAGSITFGDNVEYFEAAVTSTWNTVYAVAYSTEGTVTLSSKLKLTAPEGGSFREGSCYYYEGGKQKRAKTVIIEPADPTDIKYEVWVGATQVTGANKNDILGDGGKAKYDPSTATLTLNNPIISTNYSSGGKTHKIYAAEDITVKGSYTMTSYAADYGIYGYMNLTLDGDFTILSGIHGVYARFTLTINGSLVGRANSTTYTSSAGIKASEIKFGEITRVEAEGKKVYAIYAERGLTIPYEYEVKTPSGSYIERGTVIDNTENEPVIAKHIVIEHTSGNIGIYLGNKAVTVDNKSDIFGDGTAKYSNYTNTLTLNYPHINGAYTLPDGKTCAIYCRWGVLEDTITIKGSYNNVDYRYNYGVYVDSWKSSNNKQRGGNLILDTDNFRIGGKECAIYANKKITIQGSGSGIVVAKAKKDNSVTAAYGICAKSSVTIESGIVELTAEGTTEAIHSDSCSSEQLTLIEPMHGKIESGQILHYDGTAHVTKAVFVDQSYSDLWLGDTPVTNDNKDDIFGDGGKAKYDPDTNTLTLDDPTIIASPHTIKPAIDDESVNAKKVLIYSKHSLTVKGRLRMTDSECKYAICVENGSLTLDGIFKLFGCITAPDIFIESGSLAADGAFYGIYTIGGIYVRSDVSSVSITAEYAAIYPMAKLFIDSTLKITLPTTYMTETYGTDERIIFYPTDPIHYTGSPTTVTIVKNDDTTEKYHLWIGGTQVSAANKDNILGDGTASYDPDTKTLTLDDPIIVGNYKDAYAICSYDSLTIKGKLNYTTDDQFITPIKVSGTLTLDGDFTITAVDFGISASTIDVVSGNISVEVKKYRAMSAGNINIGEAIERFHVRTEEENSMNIRCVIDGNVSIANNLIVIEGKLNADLYTYMPDRIVLTVIPWVLYNARLGDVDLDRNVEIRDATWIQRRVADIEIPFAISKTTADVDGDGNITVMDATAIQYYLANMKNPHNIGKTVS